MSLLRQRIYSKSVPALLRLCYIILYVTRAPFVPSFIYSFFRRMLG